MATATNPARPWGRLPDDHPTVRHWRAAGILDGRDVWVLPVGPCPSCGREWAFYQPVPAAVPATERDDFLAARAASLARRGWRCHECLPGLG